jgi:TATA-binding protein-associated factor Taf7
MCDECDRLEAKIQHYRQFVKQGLDPLTVERINTFVKELEQRKENMH